jgi:hypothetical protein
MNKLLLLTILTVVNLNVYSQDRFGGQGGGNGGDTTASEFSKIALRSYLALKQVCHIQSNEKACDKLNFLMRTIYTATITLQDKVFGHNGIERDAINDGDDEIIISASRWKELSSRRKLALAIHEHLSLAGLEHSDQYFYTNEIIVTLIQYDWLPELIVSNLNLEKEYSGVNVMVLRGNQYFYIRTNGTSAHGFCKLKGFKNAISFQTSGHIYHDDGSVSINANGEMTPWNSARMPHDVIKSIICGL